MHQQLKKALAFEKDNMALQHDEFVTRLQSLFAALKRKGWKKHADTVMILLNDNILLKKQLQEKENEQESRKESK